MAKKLLLSAGYEQVSEREDWEFEAGKKYFFTRNYSTIVAFAIGKKYDLLRSSFYDIMNLFLSLFLHALSFTSLLVKCSFFFG